MSEPLTKTTTNNGCSKAIRVPKKEEGFRATPSAVATIDFGTTHCSAAFLTLTDEDTESSLTEPILLTLDDQGRKRVPSCILFDSSGVTIAFGYQARSEYAGLGRDQRPHYAFFDHVKKTFVREKV